MGMLEKHSIMLASFGITLCWFGSVISLMAITHRRRMRQSYDQAYQPTPVRPQEFGIDDSDEYAYSDDKIKSVKKLDAIEQKAIKKLDFIFQNLDLEESLLLIQTFSKNIGA